MIVPHYTLRSAILFCPDGGDLRVIYNCDNLYPLSFVETKNDKEEDNGNTDEKSKTNDEMKVQSCCIESFDYQCPQWVIQVLVYNYSDSQILDFFSTSPHVEHKNFAIDARNLFQFVAKNNCKDVFKDGKAIYFSKGYNPPKQKMEKKNDTGSSNAKS